MIRFRTRANSGAERSGVGKVKWLPALGSTATKTLAVPQRLYSLSRLPTWPGRAGRGTPQIRMERDRLFVQANHRLGGTIGLLINCQNVFHLAEVLGVQIGDTPHFFPATASGRGWSTKPGWSRAPLAEPVFVSQLPPRSALRSTALVPPAADYQPSR